MGRKVINPKNEATKLPLWPSLTMWLVLDKVQAPQWVWGAVMALLALIWVASSMAIYKQEYVDVLGGGK